MKYVPGQKWRYRTRDEDAGSVLTVLRIEELPELGEVVFISIEGLRVRDEQSPGGFRTEVAFTELTASSLDESVTELVGVASVPEHQHLYEGWRRSFDNGVATAYREPVASIVRRFQRLLEPAK